jgi:tRNA threonylcarbamoyladenosine biosynthesis protein TsaB
VLILGIETATTQVGCAIGGHEGVLASTHSARGKRHAESLTPAIEFTCRQARVELSEIGVVAVDLGPGLFTGLRVGIATGKAIAQALRVPMIGVTSLDLLAFPARFCSRLIAAVLDARRGEVFSALYRHVPGGVQRISEPQVGSPDELASELVARGEEVLMVGDGAGRYASTFRPLVDVEVVEPDLAHPSARSLVSLAHARALREEWVQPWELQPLYLRRPDAEINWSARDGA